MLKLQAGFTKSKILATLGVLGCLFAALPLWAALGGDAATVQADQVHLQGSLRTIAAQEYSVQEIQSASGTTVREYVTSSGKVFAVAWQGPWPPDLRQLLGSYFDPYIKAARAQNSSRIGRRPLAINQAGLVVQIEGHPRAYAGRAYVPDLLPSSMQVEAIR
jgi:hypothetical protein